MFMDELEELDGGGHLDWSSGSETRGEESDGPLLAEVLGEVDSLCEDKDGDDEDDEDDDPAQPQSAAGASPPPIPAQTLAALPAGTMARAVNGDWVFKLDPGRSESTRLNSSHCG